MSEQIDIEKELDEGRKPGNQTFFKKNSRNILIITRGCLLYTSDAADE